MGGFVVQDNIPIARKAVARQRSPLRKALADLEIGQCVTVFPEPGQSMKALRARLSGLTQGAKQDNPEAHYLHRTVEAQDPEDGEGAAPKKAIRIWRVTEQDADPHKSKGKKQASKKKASARAEPVQPATEPGPELTDAEAAAESERQEEADHHDPDDPFEGELDADEHEDTGEEEEDPDADDWDDGDWDEEEEDPDLDRPAEMPRL